LLGLMSSNIISWSPTSLRAERAIGPWGAYDTWCTEGLSRKRKKWDGGIWGGMSKWKGC